MAQHFQSGSPYGAPYSAGSYYPTYQQFPPQQPSSTPPFLQQNARPNAGYHASPNQNMGRFEANAQAPVPTQNFPFAPSPFTPDIFKQFANASIPPPPPPNFPPVPIPNLGFPHFNQNFPQSNPTPLQQPQTEETTSDTSDAYDPRFPQQPFYSARPGPQFPERQENQLEGQRKDGDAASSRTMSQEEHIQGSFEPSNKATYPSNFDGSIFSSQSQPKNSFSNEPQSASYPNGSTLAHSSTEHTTARNGHELVVQPQEIERPAALARPSSRSGEMASNHRPVLRNYENKTPSELRQLAKGALLSLAPHSIHYSELVQEGVNENVLQQLYHELGIKVEGPETIQLSQPDNGATEPVSSAPNEQDIPPMGPNTSHPVPQIIAPAAEAPAARPPPAVSPSLERKDRIAQLLAAKTGRPSPVRSFSESEASTSAPQVNAPQVPTSDEKNSSNAKFEEVLVQQPLPKSKPEVVQAEQEKGVSKAEAVGNTQLQPRTIDPAASSSRPFHPLAGSALQISTQTSSQDTGPLSSIPGLFMTSTDPRRNDNHFDANFWGHPEPIDLTRSSQKRSFEPDVQQVDTEPSAKRRNTDTTDAMEIDQSTEDDKASEGEVLDQEEEQVPADGRTTTPPALVAIEPTAIAPLYPSQNSLSENVKSLPSQAKTRLTSAQIAEKAEMLKARFLKQRAERQRALQDGLPGLDAEVQKTRSRLTQQQSHLAEVRVQIMKLEEELSKARAQEESLLEEIAHLEKQLREGVTGQKQYTDELKKLSSGQNSPQQGLDTATNKSAIAMPPADALEAATPILSIGARQQSESGAVEPSPPTGEAEKRSDAEVSTPSMNGNGVDDMQYDAKAGDEQDDADGTYDQDSGVENEMEALSSANGQSGGSVAGDEVVDPDPPAIPDVEDVEAAVEETVGEYEDDGEFREDSDGSASMSDSGADSGEDEEGEYEPDAAKPFHPMDLAESDEGEYDPEDMQVEEPPPDDQNSEVIPREEGEVQPAESPARPQTPSSQMSEEMVDSPPAEPANVLADDEDIPPDPLPEEPVDEVEIDDTPPQLTEHTASTPRAHPQPDADQPNPPIASQTTQQEPLTNSTNGTSTIYHPYQSPLSSFQSFRYNEQFSKAPPQTGFRSLTYSNNINPNIPLCPTELSEGVCEDATCEEQHFRHLGLSDDKILVSLSSANGMEEPLRKEYLLSLKRVIADLRRDGVKEFEGVANALSEHRRSFFKQKLEGEEV